MSPPIRPCVLLQVTNNIFPTGIQHFVISAAQPYGLPLKEVTIAQYLKALDYETHAIGKVIMIMMMMMINVLIS